ncbi:MAG: hypothetical protein JSU73_03380 [candidate division WOR-3 bacterium]|nr:MAG: hypothetical protein JSU73_03380 [candidate division WOR-3 bacterium]
MVGMMLGLAVGLAHANPQALAGLRYPAPDTATEAEDRWLAADKLWHFTASFATVGAAYHLCANRLRLPEPVPTGVAAGGTLTLGLTKEFADLSGPERHFSWKDLVADALGIAVGYLVFIHDFDR